MKLVFLGTPDFAVPVLSNLVKAGYEIGYAVTQPDRKGNRGKMTRPPVKILAEQYGIPVLQPERLSKAEDVKNLLRAYKPDAMIVVAYGQILKKDVLDIPKLGCFNVHASLLPKLRGASPIQHAILEGDKVTGVTLMKIDEGLDSGDMIAKCEISIGRKTAEQLSKDLSEAGASLLLQELPHIEDGTCTYEKQDSSKATYAGLISKKDGKIDFHQTAESSDCKIRAIYPWPGAFFDYGEKHVKIWSAEVLSGDSESVPGIIKKADADGIDITCGEGILRILELQLPGKRRVNAADFLRGHKLTKGMSIE
ncbi:MAG: methionyl-tRNA formyltransferase [Eubacteriales bacterium]|nr:methionyl-tRNA formyltransferase [Eubacteriales bacterium]